MPYSAISADMSLMDFVAQYAAARNLAPRTRRQHEGAVRSFCAFLKRDATVADMLRDDLPQRIAAHVAAGGSKQLLIVLARALEAPAYRLESKARPARATALPPVEKLDIGEEALAAGHRSLVGYYDTVYEPMKLRSRAYNTKRLYRTTLRSLARFLGRAPVLADLNNDTVNLYLAWFRNRGRSPYSVNKERFNLLALWRFAARRGDKAGFPEVESDVAPKRVPQAWTLEQMRQLVESLRSMWGTYEGIPRADWWTALHYVLWDTGERITAIISLRWDNVDLSGGWVIVPAETRKGGRADRTYRIGSDTVKALRRIAAPSRDAVFPWPYVPTYLWDVYNKILKRAGLPSDRRSKFHRIRRSVASYYEAAGGNATELLGHSSRTVTRAYLDPRIVVTKHATDVIPRLACDPPQQRGKGGAA